MAERRSRLLSEAGSDSLFQTFQPMTAANAISDAASSALVGLRRTHFLPRE